jgi:class 3 adenylate cyclase
MSHDMTGLAHELADEVVRLLQAKEIASGDFVQLRTRIHNLVTESGKSAYLEAFREAPTRFPLLTPGDDTGRAKLSEVYRKALQRYERLLRGLARDTVAIPAPKALKSRRGSDKDDALPLDIQSHVKKNTYIFFCDVVNYSTTPIQEQLTTVRSLYDVLLAAPSLRDAAPDDRLAIPTGDGGAIVFTGNADSHAPLRLAIEVHESIARQSLPFRVRIGIHCGSNYVVSSRAGRRNVIGANMNTAARIMDLAEPMQILSSAEYCALYVRKDSEFERYATPCGTYEVKHGDRVEIVNYHAADRFGVPWAPLRGRLAPAPAPAGPPKGV